MAGWSHASASSLDTAAATSAASASPTAWPAAPAAARTLLACPHALQKFILCDTGAVHTYSQVLYRSCSGRARPAARRTERQQAGQRTRAAGRGSEAAVPAPAWSKGVLVRHSDGIARMRHATGRVGRPPRDPNPSPAPSLQRRGAAPAPNSSADSTTSAQARRSGGAPAAPAACAASGSQRRAATSAPSACAAATTCAATSASSSPGPRPAAGCAGSLACSKSAACVTSPTCAAAPAPPVLGRRGRAALPGLRLYATTRCLRSALLAWARPHGRICRRACFRKSAACVAGHRVRGRLRILAARLGPTAGFEAGHSRTLPARPPSRTMPPPRPGWLAHPDATVQAQDMRPQGRMFVMGRARASSQRDVHRDEQATAAGARLPRMASRSTAPTAPHAPPPMARRHTESASRRARIASGAGRQHRSGLAQRGARADATACAGKHGCMPSQLYHPGGRWRGPSLQHLPRRRARRAGRAGAARPRPRPAARARAAGARPPRAARASSRPAPRGRVAARRAARA